MILGGDQLMAAGKVLQMLHDYFAPDALDMVNQGVVRCALRGPPNL